MTPLPPDSPVNTPRSSAYLPIAVGFSVVICSASTAAAAPVDAAPNDGPAAASDDRDDGGQVHGAKDRRLRLHFDSELLGGAWVRRATPMPAEGRDSLSIGVGLGRPSLLDDGSALFTRPIFGLGVGYLFLGTRALLGAKASLTLDAYGVDDSGRLVTMGGRVVPYFQWMFRPDHAVRPYVEVRAGIGGLSTTRRDPDRGR